MGKERRDYPELCRAVLKALKRPKTIGEVADDVDAGWKTAERALEFLDSVGAVEKIVSKPRRIYKKSPLFPIPERFIKELTLIINQKGSRYHSMDDCLDDALRDFIHREKRIKRY
jgi:hypothetical protein